LFPFPASPFSKTQPPPYNTRPAQATDTLLHLEALLKQHVLLNPADRLPYQLLFRIVWEAENTILNA